MVAVNMIALMPKTTTSAGISPRMARAGNHMVLPLFGAYLATASDCRKSDPGWDAIGKDCRQLHANHEARADHGGDNLRAEPRVLGPDCAEEPDCERDCNCDCDHR